MHSIILHGWFRVIFIHLCLLVVSEADQHIPSLVLPAGTLLAHVVVLTLALGAAAMTRVAVALEERDILLLAPGHSAVLQQF